jgi:hypothetical protein
VDQLLRQTGATKEKEKLVMSSAAFRMMVCVVCNLFNVSIAKAFGHNLAQNKKVVKNWTRMPVQSHSQVQEY